jgi:polar amino acid transport system substrate-binding protein
MKRRLVAAATVLALLAACGNPRETSDPAAPTGKLPPPVGVEDPAKVTFPSAQPPSCVPRASYRPQGALPPPRQMPAGSTMASIVQRGRLVVGVDQNAYLFGFRDPNTGQLVGFEIEIAKEVARALFGDPEAVQFRAITTADRIPVLERKEVDMVVRTMTMTCERWQQITFSTEYLTSRQRLLVNKGSGIDGFEDLGGKKVCATKGSTSIRVIASAQSKPIPVGTDSTLDCLILLQQAQVAAVSTIDVLLAALAAQDPGTEITGAGLTDEPSGIGVPKAHVDFARFINGVFERIRADGTWAAIYTRWLNRLGPTPAPPAPQYQD